MDIEKGNQGNQGNQWDFEIQLKMSDNRTGGQVPLKSALKRNTRQSTPQQQQQQQQQSQQLSKTTTPFQVPEGLRALLNEITKEVCVFFFLSYIIF